MWRKTAKPVLLMFSVLVFSAIIGNAQEQDETNQADGEQGEEQTYQGIWSARFGPVTLEWILEEDDYEFYAYQEQSVRIGSRGAIQVENGLITFVSEETTTDGSSWSEIDAPEEERRAQFGLLLTDEAIRLAQPERRQFYVEYRSREQSLLETAGTDNGTGDAAGEGDAADAEDMPGGDADGTDGTAEPGQQE
jgi:hypothetical protein